MLVSARACDRDSHGDDNRQQGTGLGARQAASGQRDRPRLQWIRAGATRGQPDVRPAAGGDRPLRRSRRCRQGNSLRPRERLGTRDPRRRAQRRLRQHRRWSGDRSQRDARRPRRQADPHGRGRRRHAGGRGRPGDPRARARDAVGDRLDRRDRRVHALRRHRIPEPGARTRRRQSPGGRRRPRRWPASTRRRAQRARPVLGPPWRRRQLRRGRRSCTCGCTRSTP